MARHRSRGRSSLVWPAFAFPGVAWLIALFVVPFYGVLAVAFGDVDPIFGSPIPVWNPGRWRTASFRAVLDGVFGGQYQPVFVRTLWYVGIALALCFVIGYPVAYYVARYGGRRKPLLLALILAPFWINYLMRMLAWINLLQDDGYVNDALRALHVVDHPVNWLNGRPTSVVLGLVYGYVPFFILPLYAALDRIDVRLLEASRDLGVGPVRSFVHVTLPLSAQGMLAASVITALPMFGDYYTTDLLSGSPRTTMIGNQIQFYLLNSPEKNVGASLVVVLSAMLMVLMAYYLVTTDRAARTVMR
jgi:ABC-type spermidine/putrescine transport system permease subunit I